MNKKPVYNYEGDDKLVSIREFTLDAPEKKIVYIDLDGVLVDYRNTDALDKYEGFLPYDGATEFFNELQNHFEVYLLSTAPWSNPRAWADKVNWVQRYLGPGAFKKLILSHNKSLNKGDYLIDDRPNNGAAGFGGEWLHFGPGNKFPDYKSVLDYLI